MMRPRIQLAVASAAVLAAVVIAYLWIDVPLSQWARGLGWQVHLRWEPVTKLGLSTWYLIGLAVLAACFRFALARPIAFNRCVFMFLTVMWSGLLVVGLKFVLGRSRPALLAQGHYGFNLFETEWGFNSMPSGHASTVAALAACMCVLYPRGRWLWIALALPIAASRVVIATHYLSDVLLGSYVAVLIMLVNLHVLERWGVRLRAAAPPSTQQPQPLAGGPI